MDSWILELLTQAGPVFAVAIAFLLWDLRKQSAGHRREAQRDKEFSAMLCQLLDVVNRNTDAMHDLVKHLVTRPCLWEETMEKTATKIEAMYDHLITKLVKKPDGRSHD